MYTYLRVTIYDNDYWLSGRLVCDMLHDLINFIDEDIKDEDLPELADRIQNLWYETYKLDAYLEDQQSIRRYGKAADRPDMKPKDFHPDLKIVTADDLVHEDGNNDIYFIPLKRWNDPVICM